MNKKTEEQKQALDFIKKMVKPGDTVYTVCNHVSASGMSRDISLYIPATRTYSGKRQKAIINLSWHAAKAMGYNISKNNGGIKVQGCGMDMGYHIVYSLGATIWPKGTKKAHGTRNGEPDFNGGYALKQQWL